MINQNLKNTYPIADPKEKGLYLRHQNPNVNYNIYQKMRRCTFLMTLEAGSMSDWITTIRMEMRQVISIKNIIFMICEELEYLVGTKVVRQFRTDWMISRDMSLRCNFMRNLSLVLYQYQYQLLSSPNCLYNGRRINWANIWPKNVTSHQKCLMNVRKPQKRVEGLWLFVVVNWFIR